MAEVQILLSTHNGEAWLPELLLSLQQQTFTDWQLVVRDDASQDQTVNILMGWQQQHPNKIAFCELDGEQLGVTASFSRLVEMSEAPLLMFCDQDDIWFPEKIEVEQAAMMQLMAEYGESVPLLVHADLALVSADKNLLAASFWEWRDFNVHQSKQAYLLTNTVTGCATLFNRAAANQAFPMPCDAGLHGNEYEPPALIRHDRWLALVCAWFGQVKPIDQPLLLYRQHANNTEGAGLRYYQHVSTASIAVRLENWSWQATIFLQCFSHQLSMEDRQLIMPLADVRCLKGWKRRRHIIQHRLFKQGVLANLALLCFA